MPANSKAFRRAAAIAEHHPEKLYKRNRGLAKMDQGDLHDFASTPEKGLPTYAENVKRAVGSKGKMPDKIEPQFPDTKYPPRPRKKK